MSGEADRSDEAPLAYQARWIADKSPLKVAHVSRQIGMTWAASRDALAVGAGEMNVYYVGSSFGAAEHFMRECGHGLGPVVREDWKRDKSSPVLRASVLTPNGEGMTVFAGEFSAGQLRGKKGYFIIDDAAVRDDLHDLVVSLGGALMWGGRIAMISCYASTGPDSAIADFNNEFHSFVGSIKSGNQDGALHEVDIYDALADGLYRKTCEVRGTEWSEGGEERWLADIRSLMGRRFAVEFECYRLGPRAERGLNDGSITRILLDLDGVLADWSGSVAPLFGMRSQARDVRGARRDCRRVDRRQAGDGRPCPVIRRMFEGTRLRRPLVL